MLQRCLQDFSNNRSLQKFVSTVICFTQYSKCSFQSIFNHLSFILLQRNQMRFAPHSQLHPLPKTLGRCTSHKLILHALPLFLKKNQIPEIILLKFRFFYYNSCIPFIVRKEYTSRTYFSLPLFTPICQIFASFQELHSHAVALS